MIVKSVLLGGAVALALAGAGIAQPATDTSPSKQTQTHSAKTVHHYRHHMRHHVRTAALHPVSSPAERRATQDLNMQQVQTAQYGAGPRYAQGASQAGAYPAEPGPNNGLTPTSRIPNGNPFGTAAPAGGAQDTPVLDQAHQR